MPDPLDTSIDFSQAKRGAVNPPDASKQRITIRLDQTVLEYFKTIVATNAGGSYQRLINDALLTHIERETQGERYKESELKRIVREVLEHQAA